MVVLPIAVVEVTVAGARVSGRNRQIIACRLNQNGNTTQGWDTIRPKKQVSSGSFVKALWKVIDLRRPLEGVLCKLMTKSRYMICEFKCVQARVYCSQLR